MALLWIDGFDSYGATIGSAVSPTEIVTLKYEGSGTGFFTVQDGRVSGHSLKMPLASAYIVKVLPGVTDATTVVGVAVKFAALVDSSFLSLYSGGSDYTQVDLRVTAGGELAVYLGGTLSATTSGLGLEAGTWYCLALKAVCGATGSYTVYKDTTSVLSESGVDTRGDGGTSFLAVWLNSGVDTLYPTYDDFYWLDGTGTFNNDVLGPVHVVTLRPNGAGAHSDWTPSSGSNYACVSEAVCDYAASTVQDGTSGDCDTYQYEAIPSGIASVLGVMVTTDCTVVSPDTSATLYTVCHRGFIDETDLGNDVESYLGWQSCTCVFGYNPTTGIFWTPDSFGLVQFGIEVG